MVYQYYQQSKEDYLKYYLVSKPITITYNIK